MIYLYSLTAENRNGKETVDLDLIVLNTLPDCDCNLFLASVGLTIAQNGAA